MKKLFSLLLFTSLLFLVSCFAPTSAKSQNVEGWFCKGLYMNGVTTGVPTNWRNINGQGIYGTDTTISINLSESNFCVGWWAISCQSTAVGTGTQGYVQLFASNDGATYFNTRADTSTKITSTLTPWWKWTVTSSGSTVFTSNRWPYKQANLYIVKGNTTTTLSCFYKFEKQYTGK